MYLPSIEDLKITHYKDYLHVKDLFLLANFNIEIDINLCHNGKVISESYYSKFDLHYFFTHRLTNEMHQIIANYAHNYDISCGTTIFELRYILIKIYLRYYNVYLNNIMPDGVVRLVGRVQPEDRLLNFLNRMIIVMEKIDDNTWMDFNPDEPQYLILKNDLSLREMIN